MMMYLYDSHVNDVFYYTSQKLHGFGIYEREFEQML